MSTITNTDFDGSVVDNLKALTGVRYNRAEYNKDILDTYLLREARKRGVRLPSKSEPDRFNFFGAFVETPRAGISEHVVYCDLASLYPSLLRSLNASPETIIGTRDDLRDSEYTEDDCVWSYIDTRPVKHVETGESWREYTHGRYKMVYDPSQQSIRWRDDPQTERCYFLDHEIQQGFVPSCVEDLLELKEQYRGTPLYGSTKRVVNSIYGILTYSTSDNAYRLYDWRLGEAVTLAGRRIIKHSRDYILSSLAEQGFTEAYAAGGDTDATAVSVPTADTRHRALTAVQHAVDELNDTEYDQFMQETFNVAPQHQQTELEVESYAPRLFVPADDDQPDYPHTDVGVKKRYMQWVTVEDGDAIDPDSDEPGEIDITGLEHERSDVAPVTKDAQQHFAQQVLRNGPLTAKDNVFERLRSLDESIRSGSVGVEYVAKRSGIGQSIEEYGSPEQTPQPMYRGARYAHRHVDGETVQRGDKVKLVYVTDTGSLPARYDQPTAAGGRAVDAIAVTDTSNLSSDVVVDWDRHAEKVLWGPMRTLVETLGWDRDAITHGHEQSGLDAF